MIQNREQKPLITSVTDDCPHVLGLTEHLTRLEKLDIAVTYSPNWSNRISGTITGNADHIRRVFKALETNEPVGCRDLIEAIKHVRTKIFQAKQRHTENCEWSKTRGPR